MQWKYLLEKAYKDDGELFFPERLNEEFLEDKRRSLGSYIYANQYLNEIIPAELQTFKKEWFKYFEVLPRKLTTFIFIDPALSEADSSDNTGVVVVSIDEKKDWFVRYASRHRLSPTKLISFVFEIAKEYDPQGIGIEEVAYQKVLLYNLDEEMRRRNIVLPVKGIKPPTDKTKQMRILSLVPRFEWNHIFLSSGLTDLELELLQFPRGSHDDVIDALAYVEWISYPPDGRDVPLREPAPNHPDYEKWYIQNRLKERMNGTD